MPSEDKQLGKSSYQKRVIRELRRHRTQATQEFLQQEADHGLSRSVKAVRVHHPAKQQRTQVPRLKVANAAVAKAMNAARVAKKKRGLVDKSCGDRDVIGPGGGAAGAWGDQPDAGDGGDRQADMPGLTYEC